MRKNNKTDRRFSGKTLLELFAAAFILLAPSVPGTDGWGLYALFILMSAVFAVRLTETKKVHISVNAVLGIFCTVYALLALFWASGPYYHVRLIFTLLNVVLGGLLAADYFEQERGSGLGERLAGLLTASAFICAAGNIIAWAVFDGFSMAAPFCRGLGDNEALGAFMLVGMVCCVRTLRPRTVKRKKNKNLGVMAAAGLPMLFVLIMSRCFVTGIFAGMIMAVYFWKQSRRGLCAAGGGIAVLSAVGLALLGRLSPRPFADGLISGLTHPAGLGGGGFIVRQGELQSEFYQASGLGAGAELVSSLGLAGLLAALAFVGWAGYMAVSRKSWISALGAAFCVFMFFVRPCSYSLLMVTGLLVYGEWRQGVTGAVKLKNRSYAVAAVLAAAAVLACILTAGEAFKSAGVYALKRGDLRAAADSLGSAAKIDPLDGESCAAAAEAYRELYDDGTVKNDIVNSEYYIKLAIEREERRALYYALYADIKAAGGSYGDAVELDRRALELAPLWDDCRVNMAGHLFSMIQTLEKGSFAAQSCHMEILSLADEINDLEKKKIVSDYEAKAQPYTRVEYNYDDAGAGENDGEKSGEEADE